VKHNLRRFTRTAALAVAVAMAASGLAGCSRPEQLPDFSYTTLDGRRASSSALRGKVVLVNFWATSCASCVAEMPQITATHQRFKARGFETVAVAMSYDPPARVADFAESRRLPFQVVIDNTGAIAKELGDVRVTPTTLLVDRQGRVVQRIVGEPDFGALNALIDRLLEAG
jgi:peroxiredoxin